MNKPTHLGPGASIVAAATHHNNCAPMPTAYELMEAYRSWWRASYSTSPNSQAVALAAAWAQHALEIYRDGSSVQPTAEPTK